MSTRRGFLAALAVTAGLLPLGAAQAQEKLDLATIVVGFPPGGGTDAVARVVAEAITGTYADSVVVENRPGAAGRIAAAYVKDAPQDGSVLLFTPSFPLVIHPHLYEDMPFDTLTDLAPVVSTHFGVLALSVGPAVPEEIDTLDAFLEWAQENPDLASYGAPAGGSQHFSGIALAEEAGVGLEMIAYPGGAPSVTDALGGHLPAVITPLSEVLPHVEEGTLRILALTSAERFPLTPDYPTFTELGYDVVVESFSGFFAPAGMPQEVLEFANQAISDAITRPEVEAKMEALGNVSAPTSVEEFTQIVNDNWREYEELVAESGFTIQQ